MGEPIDAVARLVLTASGGPFRGRDPGSLAEVSAEEALAHPTWRMGPKITIDSATLVNKAFEVIEAKWLYRLPYSKIDAVIHPQSVVHSLVEFADGSVQGAARAARHAPPDPVRPHIPGAPAIARPSRVTGGVGRASSSCRSRPDAYPAYDVVRAAAAEQAATAARS